jgi:hypothetical protein
VPVAVHLFERRFVIAPSADRLAAHHARAGRAAPPAPGRWQVGGITAHLLSTDSHLAIAAPPALAPFTVGPVEPDVTVTASWGSLDTASRRPVIFDSGGVWVLRDGGDHLRFEFRSPKFGATPYKLAEFAPDFSGGHVTLHRPFFPDAREAYPLEFPLDELIFTNRLAHHAGVELHGCGVAYRHRGYLFLGCSGAGKSTMARLWRNQPDATVLSDDRIVVRMIDGRPMMYGTPWHGDEPVSAPGPVPLERLLFLRQGPLRLADALRSSASVAALFTCCFAPFHSREALAATLGTLEAIAESAPPADLWFTPELDARAILDRIG